MEKSKPTRGGARKGSGRKKLDHDVLYVRLPHAIAEKIKENARKEGITIGAYLLKSLNL